MLLTASPTTPGAARRAATPAEASLVTAAVAAAVVVVVVVVVNVRCSPLCAPTVALTPRCRSARVVTVRSTAATVSTACGTKRGVVPLFAGVLKHLAVHSLIMAARCTFWFCPGGLEGIQVPLWQFQGFCVDLTHCTWSKCRFADAMLAASHRMAAGRGSIVTRHYGVVAYVGTAAHSGWREASPFGRTRDGSVIVAGRFLSVAAGAACYALLSPPLPGRFGRVRCSVLLGRRGALRFRGLLAFLTWPGTWATSSKTVSLGLSAWTVVVSPFTDVFAGFRLRVLAVGAGELAFLDWGSADLAFLRCLRRAITKVDSKVRSLDSPA